MKNFSVIAKPLTSLTTKDSALHWTVDCQTAFDKLKEILTGPALVAYPRDEGAYILDTDACDVGIGAVLSQIQDGTEKVVAYGSRTLNKAERNYCVTDKELLAVRYFIEYFRYYLLGRRFTVRSDHQALKWIFSLREPKGRIARWLEIMSAYDFSVKYREGKRHGNADGLSRCPNPRDCHCGDQDDMEQLKCGPCKKCIKRGEDMLHAQLERHPIDEGLQTPDPCAASEVEDSKRKVSSQTGGTLRQNRSESSRTEFPQIQQVKIRKSSKLNVQKESYTQNKTTWFQGYSANELSKLQREDPNIGPLIQWMEAKERPFGAEMCTSSPETRNYWNYWNSLEMKEGLLWKNFHKHDGTQSFLQLIAPSSMRPQVFKAMHSCLLSGHLGKRKTTEKILQRYYWYNLREDVNNWLQECDICAANKKLTRHPRAPLGDMRVGAPLDRICTDILGPLPITPRGNQYILVVTDSFSKWVEAYPIHDTTATTTAQVILNEFISRFGCPLDVHSDQGRNYESRLFTNLCKLLEIRKTRTSPRHPQGNGQVERFNKTLVKMIKAYIKDQDEWDLHLGCLTGAYRATPHESTGLTPNMVMLGREVKLPMEVTMEECSEQNSYGEYVDNLRLMICKAHTLTRKHLQQATYRQKEIYDTKTLLHEYQSGDLVWYLNESRKEGISPKLQNIYSGPYLVLKGLNRIDYLIQLDRKGTQKVVHHDKLKPYLGLKILKWSRKAMAAVKP